MSDALLDGYLPEEEVARQLDRKVRTLQRWRKNRTGPPVTYIGPDPYYRVEAFRAWLLARERPMVRAKSGKREARRQVRKASAGAAHA